MNAPDHRTEDDKLFAFVRCAGDCIPGQQPCGLVGLTEMEYLRQLDKPDIGWWCPTCGSSADYDDVASEEAQGINDEEDPADEEANQMGLDALMEEDETWRAEHPEVKS